MKKRKNKYINVKAMKSYFIIFNLIFAIIAFSVLFNAQAAGDTIPTGPIKEGWTYQDKTAGTTTPIGTSSGGGVSQPPTFDPKQGDIPVTENGALNGNTPSGTSSGPSNPPVVTPPITQGSTCPPGGCGTNPIGAAGTSGSAAGTTLPGKPGEIVKPAQPMTAADAMKDYTSNFLTNIGVAAGIGMLGAFVGKAAGGKNGEIYGFLSFFAGSVAFQIAKSMTASPLMAAGIGIGVGALIFLLTYKKESEEQVSLSCLPWQAPIGGQDCEKCNNLKECSEYSCKALGQACDIVNVGTPNQKCVWKNPRDVNSPIIKVVDVTKGHVVQPDNTIRPPATGVKIKPAGAECIKAFTPLEFTITTLDSASGLGEPSQCKIDYNMTNLSYKGFNDMSFYVGGSNVFDYNHTEKLSLPGPDSINKIAPELKNDGVYTLFVLCQDANGNINGNPFAIKFCVEKGPDSTPPIITDVSIPSGSPILFNRTNVDIEVYVNEPSDCKWSHKDGDYKNMENNMSCDRNLWEMNNNNVYTCRANLNGIENRKENIFYFRCKDKPDFEEADRNENKQSFIYRLIGTQPLNILESGPNSTIFGATDTIPVNITVRTDNGFKNGESICYYSTVSNESGYVQFLYTNTTNIHIQRQDLPTGDYKYYLKCVDMGGNAAYTSIKFRVETDRIAPVVSRVYQEGNNLKIITNEKSECSYSYKDCNFEIDSGIKMSTFDNLVHTVEWKINQVHYIRCKDKYNNQPDPTWCSVVARPSDKTGSSGSAPVVTSNDYNVTSGGIEL